MYKEIKVVARGVSRSKTGRTNDADIVWEFTSIEKVLKDSLREIGQVESEGYDPMDDDDAEWEYITMLDEAVCMICEPMHGNIYTSKDVQAKFPYYIVDIEGGFLRANTHMPRDPYCRCKLKPRNLEGRAFENFVGRLERIVG